MLKLVSEQLLTTVPVTQLQLFRSRRLAIKGRKSRQRLNRPKLLPPRGVSFRSRGEEEEREKGQKGKGGRVFHDF